MKCMLMNKWGLSLINEDLVSPVEKWSKKTFSLHHLIFPWTSFKISDHFKNCFTNNSVRAVNFGLLDAWQERWRWFSKIVTRKEAWIITPELKRQGSFNADKISTRSNSIIASCVIDWRRTSSPVKNKAKQILTPQKIMYITADLVQYRKFFTPNIITINSIVYRTHLMSLIMQYRIITKKCSQMVLFSWMTKPDPKLQTRHNNLNRTLDRACFSTPLYTMT